MFKKFSAGLAAVVLSLTIAVPSFAAFGGGPVFKRNVGIFNDGTSTRPSITFSKETDLGFYRSGANTITVVGGTLAGSISGTAALATTVTITDNESTNEENAIIFTAGGDLDGGDLGLESDGDLKYNPSTGTLTSTNFTGALSGNASTATALATGRTIAMTGDVAWTSPTFAGTGNVTAISTIQANSVALSTDTTGNYVGTITAGTGLSSTGATSGEGIAHTLSVDAAQTQITSVGALAGLTTTGGSSVFNSTSGDYDFTVKTPNIAKMIFVDSGNEIVSIGGTAYTSTTPLTVTGTARTGSGTREVISIFDNTPVADAVGSGILLGGRFEASTNLTEFASIWTEKENSTSGQYGGELKLGTRPHGGGIATAITISSAQNVTFAGGVVINGGLDTATGGTASTFAAITTGDATLDGNVTINDSGADRNFRVESDDNEYMIYVDGNKNAIVTGANSDLSDIDNPFLVATKALTATTNTSFSRFKITGAGGAVTVPSGTAPIIASGWIQEPNITATGTVTASASLYIQSAASEATNNYALWVDAGSVRIDSLAGSGTRNVVVDANGVLSAP